MRDGRPTHRSLWGGQTDAWGRSIGFAWDLHFQLLAILGAAWHGHSFTRESIGNGSLGQCLDGNFAAVLCGRTSTVNIWYGMAVEYQGRASCGSVGGACRCAQARDLTLKLSEPCINLVHLCMHVYIELHELGDGTALVHHCARQYEIFVVEFVY